MRRRIREAYRLNKHVLYNSLTMEKLDVMFVYLSTEVADYKQIELCMRSLLDHIGRQTHSNTDASGLKISL